MSDLPSGWEARESRSTGQMYYLNQFTKQSQVYWLSASVNHKPRVNPDNDTFSVLRII